MIKLSHSGTSVELRRFKATASLPRSQDGQSRLGLDHSYAGNAYAKGPRRTTHMWQFTAQVDEAQWKRLQLIDSKSQAAGRTAPYSGFEIELLDRTQAITETTQSRAADGMVANNPDGSVTYFPVWKATFVNLELEQEGRVYWAICSLKEASSTTP